MNVQQKSRIVFIFNVITLLLMVIFSFLLLFEGIQLTFRPLKIVVFVVFNISTFFGFYLSRVYRIKRMARYYLIVLLSPIVLILGCVFSGNGIVALHCGFQIVLSTFQHPTKLVEKEGVYVKRCFSLLTNQLYELKRVNALYERRVGRFQSDEEFIFVDFSVYDSVGKKYIKLMDQDDITQVEEIIE